MGFKHPYSSLQIKMIRPSPTPPATEVTTPSDSANPGAKNEANNNTVEASMAVAHNANGQRFAYSGPILRASKTNSTISTTALKSNRSRVESENAGKFTNEPTNVISIHARYTPRPKNASGMGAYRPLNRRRA